MRNPLGNQELDANPAPPASDAPAPPLNDDLFCANCGGLKSGHTLERLGYRCAIGADCWYVPRAASPAQEATPPREERLCPDCSGEGCNGCNWTGEADPFGPSRCNWCGGQVMQYDAGPGCASCGAVPPCAAPTPEASTPRHVYPARSTQTDSIGRCVTCGAEYGSAAALGPCLPTRAGPLEEWLSAQEAGASGVPAIDPALLEAWQSIAQFREENAQLRATVAALTAERTRLQQQNAGGTTDHLPAFAAQTEDRLAELNLRLPNGEFDEDDVRLVDDARFAITELLARVERESTGCCAKCGWSVKVEAGPVNDIMCTHVEARCACAPASINLWPKAGAARASQRGAP